MKFFRSFLTVFAVVIVACNGSDSSETATTNSPYVTDADQWIDLDGQSIRYRETGPKEAQAVLLLHGFTDSLHTWDEVADILDEDFRVVRADLPGHGLSGPNPNDVYTNDVLVEFVADFINATAMKRPILVGNSLGGLAAWRLAAKSDDVGALVLLSPGGIPHNGVGEEPGEVKAMLSYYLKSAPRAGVKMALKAMHADPNRVSDDRIDEFRAMMADHGESFVKRAESFTLPEPTEALNKISVPTTIIWGEEDSVLPVAHSERFKHAISDVTLIRLKDVGHMPQSEAAARVADAVRETAFQMKETP